jgi:hypothetical protein
MALRLRNVDITHLAAQLPPPPRIYSVSAQMAELQTTPDEDRFETNLCAHRKLHPLLIRLDLELQIWAPWAKPTFSTGFPTRWVTERMTEGGIPDKGGGKIPLPVWPENVAAADAAISHLPTRHIAAVMANYFHMSLPCERRSKIYEQLARFLARTRPQHVRTASWTTGSESFRRDLDRARWTLRALLNV